MKSSSDSVFRTAARRLGIGHALRLAYHTPVSRIRDSIRAGGPLEVWRTERGRLEMVEAAKAMSTLSPPAEDHGFEVHYLTGAKFWYQTLFCHASLQHHAPSRITPVLYDDGSLSGEYKDSFLRVIPWARIISHAEIEGRLDHALPWSHYPMLRKRRIEYPHLRKLTDVHAGGEGWKLVLDSDMLFFSTPDFVLDWLSLPDRPCHMVDVAESYGYSRALLERLAGHSVPERLNVGFCGFRSEEVDWKRLEMWCAAMIQQEGSSYYQEQALTAMLMAGRDRAVAPPDEYLVLPSLEEGRDPSAVMHHYVAESKRSYFQYGWRHALSVLENEANYEGASRQ